MSDHKQDAIESLTITVREQYLEIERLEAKAERSRVILDIAYERCMKAEDRVAELEAEVKALWLEKIERTNVASRYAIDTTPDSEGENNE